MILILALAPIAAQTPYQEHRCDAPMTQLDMNICAGLDFEAADKALNLLWREEIATAREADRDLDRRFDKRPGAESVLRAAQRAWVQFRDAHCTHEGYEARGGSMEPLLYNGCRAHLTRERISQLKSAHMESR